MHYRLLYPSEYLCAADLHGKDVTLTVAGLQREELPLEGTSKKEGKWIVSFAEMASRPTDKQKRMVINKTNLKTIAKVYGPEVNDWSGKRITLFATTCKLKGEVVECIRIRDRKPADGKSTPEPEA